MSALYFIIRKVTMLRSLISLFSSLAAKTVLICMGWSLPGSKVFKRINKYDRVVGVFSHTSYADFYIMVLYKLAYLDKLQRVRTLVKPQPFEYAGWFLRSIGAIPSTKIEEKKGGAVSRIVNELKENKQCLFLISPKGTIVKAEWRSGYFAIAKELDAELMVMGFDYEKKCVVASKQISHKQGEEAVKEFLQNRLKNIVPLFPEDEIVPIRDHVEDDRGIISSTRLFAIISAISTTIVVTGLHFFY